MIEYKQLKKRRTRFAEPYHWSWSLVSGHHRGYTRYIAFDKTIPSGA